MPPRLLLLLVASGALACTSGGERPLLDGQGGAQVGGATSGEDLLPIQLPFALTEHYVPTGFMGDGVQGQALLLDTNCQLPAPPDSQGDCFRLTYLPSRSTLTGWAGLYFQSEPDNWGEAPGHLIAPGARSVSFYAAANREVLVTFLLGGIGGASTAYRDSFRKAQSIVVGTEFELYRLEFDDETYERVLGGFGLVLSKGDVDDREVTLYLDGVVWH